MKRLIIILLTACMLLPTAVTAGAWTRDLNGYFLKLGYDRWFTSERFDTSGVRVPFEEPEAGFVDPSAYRNQALRLYGEYGVTRQVTLIAATSYEWIESEGKGIIRRSSGLGDLWISVKGGLLPGPIVLSIQGDAKLPTGYDETLSPALGNGKVDWGGRMIVGASNAVGYATAEVGYLFRGGDLADEIPVNAEVGYSIRPEVGIKAELRSTFTGQRPRASSAEFDPALAESQSVTGSLGVVFRGNPLDLVFTVDHVLGGENTLAGTRYTFSIWIQR